MTNSNVTLKRLMVAMTGELIIDRDDKLKLATVYPLQMNRDDTLEVYNYGGWDIAYDMGANVIFYHRLPELPREANVTN